MQGPPWCRGRINLGYDGQALTQCRKERQPIVRLTRSPTNSIVHCTFTTTMSRHYSLTCSLLAWALAPASAFFEAASSPCSLILVAACAPLSAASSTSSLRTFGDAGGLEDACKGQRVDSIIEYQSRERHDSEKRRPAKSTAAMEAACRRERCWAGRGRAGQGRAGKQ